MESRPHTRPTGQTVSHQQVPSPRFPGRSAQAPCLLERLPGAPGVPRLSCRFCVLVRDRAA